MDQTPEPGLRPSHIPSPDVNDELNALVAGPCVTPSGRHSWSMWFQLRDPMHDLTPEHPWRYGRECMISGCNEKQKVIDLAPVDGCLAEFQGVRYTVSSERRLKRLTSCYRDDLEPGRERESFDMAMEIQALRYELAAYKKAKAENDERYMGERDRAKQELAVARQELAELRKAAEVL